MADTNEDLRPSPQTHEDIDLSDEIQDFRFLATLSLTTTSTDYPSLPRRGEKDFESHGTSAQQDALSASRTAMHTALSHPRIHAPKNLLTGFFDRESGMTYVASEKGQHFRTMGKMDKRGRMWLLPEEALYLLERGNLDLRLREEGEEEKEEEGGDEKREEVEEGLPFSLQQAYTFLVGRLGLTLERYTVYAGLKRSGYIVQRGLAWYAEDKGGDVVQLRERVPAKGRGLFAWLQSVVSWSEEGSSRPIGPLVGVGLYRSYAAIYRRLALIPFHDPALPTERELQSQAKPAESTGGPTDQRHPVLRVAFYVWKPRPAFKKSSPGPPDFRIAVLNAREDNFPHPEQLDGLLQSVPYDPPPERMEKQMYQKLRHGWRNVILAAVDQGVVSYVRIADAGFGKEKLYERTGGGRGGKRGGGRGGRGGRGRGRGNRR